MKNRFFAFICIFIAIATFASNENFPVGARAAALGNAATSVSDAWSAAHNQAGLAFIHNTAAGIYYENRFLIKELSIRSGVLAIPLKTGTIGLSLTDFGYTLYKENKYSLSFAKTFSKTFSIGMALDYLNIHIAEDNGSFAAVTGEIGIQAKLRKDLVIAAHLYNPTRSRLDRNTSERIPTVLQLGMCYSFSSDIFLTVETEKDIAKNPIFKAGIEYQPVHHFYLRIGVSAEPVLTTFGFGVHLNNFQIDLSVNYHQTLGITPQLGLPIYLVKAIKLSATTINFRLLFNYSVYELGLPDLFKNQLLLIKYATPAACKHASIACTAVTFPTQ
jgi:hypothetical protein